MDCNSTVEIHVDNTERVDDDGRDRRSMKELYAVKTVSKTLDGQSEGVERGTTDPLQIPAIHKHTGSKLTIVRYKSSPVNHKMRSKLKIVNCQIVNCHIENCHIENCQIENFQIDLIDYLKGPV